ncbi:GNAT family N-acetyltransferase [Clostridium sp. WILCCON 0269]|uniref:GNAT family N-acetyltransferase n=1 Tax=Candidatus Clostridium eludens TaxID=3381663 RepID=A0ABW8SM42_9CLOT
MPLYLQDGYIIKSLTIEDIQITEALCIKCSDYYILHYGLLPSIEKIKEIFTELPPNKSYEDKFVLGVFKDNNELIGIIDIVRNFPDIGEWMIGLMLIAPEERGNGLGKKIHKAVALWAIKLGAKFFRIGVIADNYKGINFWHGLGYIKIKEVSMDLENKTHIVNVMTLQVSE